MVLGRTFPSTGINEAVRRKIAMSAKHALLGLLLDRPAYRYGLGDRLRERLGPAWDINSGHLYQTVERLERDGFVERVGDPGEKATDRLQFAITDSGVEEFERWFDGDASKARLIRRPLLVKITLAGPRRLSDALAQIDAYERSCAAQLKDIYRAHEAIEPAPGPRVRADHILLRLNLTADIRQLEGELQWARHAREIVLWLLDQEAIWPSAHERASAPSEEERRIARAELFGRMAADHLRAAPTNNEQATPASGRASSQRKRSKSRRQA
jgi:DNA-binding PadR family transcriptional regulator